MVMMGSSTYGIVEVSGSGLVPGVAVFRKCEIRKSETEGIQNQDKAGTKANKQKPPPHEKKRTPDMGVRSGAQEE
ncbi:hypothetical protein FSP39_002471 [Pinctada imbricata]|uniref:Uncharacterized protein n=1 Tax=Pinctada imbricata TaxID=66713 RepID=A0AA89BLC8_PINIB|nr:hypothetical protein FSP39_002471 [Pinctada imbricata]